ncbi:hypothetical protein GCM10022200_27670 [Microbacterium awajiense]|uniref:STAS/SEC14 domain-containing protein n=1 Tax=Microbacterium awajiense TaxID=415214 RepID=A0ABP7AY66_9MICO
MLEQIENLPDGVIGFRATGKVDASDYETVMDPAVDAVIADGGTVNCVYVMGEGFEGYTLGGAWQDMLLEGKPHHVWGRAALVTDDHAMASIVHGLAFLFPGQLKVFPLAQEQDAVAWAAGADS